MDADLARDAATALTRAGRGAVLSHETAAAVHGLELVDAPARRLTVPRNRSRLVVPGWVVHRADCVDAEEVGGLRVTPVPRTVADLARVLDVGPAVAAADSALRQGLASVDGLALRTAVGRGAVRLRRVGCLLDPLAESVLESLLRVVLVEDGVPRPVTQHVVLDRRGAFVARVDFAWPASRLVVEADGYAFHSDRQSYRSDRRRLNELERAGWRVLRFSWEDVRSRPDAVVALVRDCLAVAA